MATEQDIPQPAAMSLACYLRCAGYELRPPRVERGFVLLLLYETIYEPKVEGNQK
jgi:hypothetical protein